MKKICIATALLLFAGFTLCAQPTTFYPKGIGGGGALFFPTVNPANDNEFYVSCDMSELFHSTDFGNSYSQVHFSRLQVFNTSTYEFTSNPNIAYCNFNDGNEGFPVKTTDGGASWSTITGYNMSLYGHVYTMRANYNKPSQLLIGSYGDILFTNDGGSTFSLVKHAANMGAGIIIGGVFWDDVNIYIGTNEGILHSNNDGASFAFIPTFGMTAGQVIWSFAGAKASGTTRFVCIAANVSDTYNGIMPWDYWNFAKAVYTMDNANGTWIPKSTGINFSTDFIMYAAMAGNDINTIYLGGNDNALYAPLVIKSTDGGSSWAKKFNTANNANIITGWEGYNGDKNWSWSETCFGISTAPNNSSKVLFGSFSNVEVSSDGGNNWKQAYVNSADQHPAGAATPKNQAYHSIGLENTTCWQVHWRDANTMMGCFSDIGGIRSTDAGTSWGYQYSGFSVNSLYRIAEGSDGKMYGGCSNIHDIYQSTRLADAQLDASDGNGKIVWSADNGATWSDLHNFGHPVYWLAIDPNDGNTMYASVIHFGGTQGSQLGGIYVTHDLNNLAGSTWTKLANPPRTEGHPACMAVLNDGKVLCTFSGRRNSSGAFTASSGLFVYDPLSSSSPWTDVSDPGMYYWTQDVIIDPNDAQQNTWYVCVYSGWGGPPNGLGGLYKTMNRGANWTKVSGPQFDRVTSITFNPGQLTQAYLTTETQGLWKCDYMMSATYWTLVQAYPFRQPQRVFFNPFDQNEMWVTSFGNGMKVGNLDSISGIVTFPHGDKKSLTVFPDPCNGSFIITTDADLSRGGNLEIWSLTGAMIYSRKIGPVSGNLRLPVTLTNPSKGIYFIKLITQNEMRSSKLIVN
ncbi:MAG: T9SS type A sorting domain-containing protein [Bacteroidetes bacterium]|nr:T9SS type A sorting domain-containing protein [Bacteroidota bacterium]